MKTREDFRFKQEYGNYLKERARRQLVLDVVHAYLTEDLGFACVDLGQIRAYERGEHILHLTVGDELHIDIIEIPYVTIDELLRKLDALFGEFANLS